jgi:hypothetical protein
LGAFFAPSMLIADVSLTFLRWPFRCFGEDGGVTDITRESGVCKWNRWGYYSRVSKITGSRWQIYVVSVLHSFWVNRGGSTGFFTGRNLSFF